MFTACLQQAYISYISTSPAQYILANAKPSGVWPQAKATRPRGTAKEGIRCILRS